MATTWRLPDLAALTTYIDFQQGPGYLDRMLKGQTRGRVVVRLE